MRTGTASEDPVLVLQADQIHIAEVEKVRGLPVGSQVVLRELESHPDGIVVTLFGIVDRKCQQLRRAVFRVQGVAQVGCERGDSTMLRKIIAHHRDSSGKCWARWYRCQ